jgi:tetratricopeptide (TPR) repeat protein
MVRFSRLAFAVLIAFAVVATFQHSAGAQAAKATKPAAAKPAAAKSATTKSAVPDSLPKLEAAVKKDSTNAKATYRLGIAYLDRDRPIEAARMFQLATKSKPDYVEAWVNLGAAEDANGRGGDARAAYRRALALRSNDQIAMCRLASSYYAVGQRDSAMDVLREQIKNDPKAHCAYFTLGVAFADANMFRDAIKAWQKVVEIAPKSPEAESATESIKLLQEYLGPQEALAPKVTPAEGVALGSGGPSTTLPGGGMTMTSDQKKETEKLTKKAGSDDMKEAHGTKVEDDKKKK